MSCDSLAYLHSKLHNCCLF